MRALMCREFGPPEKLGVEELPDPVPGEGEVVVDVHASALGFPDVLLIQEQYQCKETLPFIPGGQVAGACTQRGDRESPAVTLAPHGRVGRWRSGPTVAARCGGRGARDRRTPRDTHEVSAPSAPCRCCWSKGAGMCTTRRSGLDGL